MSPSPKLTKEERERIARRRSDELMEERRRAWTERLEQRRTNRRSYAPPDMPEESDDET